MANVPPTSQPSPPPLNGLESRLCPSLDDVVVQATGIRKSFGGNLVLEDVDITLGRGEVVLLRGDNGSGKTTLLNILTGSIGADAGTLRIRTSRADHQVDFARTDNRSWITEPAFRVDALARSGLGRSWQDARLFATQALLDNVAVAAPAQLGERPWWPLLRRRAVQRQEEELRGSALDLLSRLGLADRAESSADRISLGQSKRVVIARAVHAGAEVLLLDEPLAGLDNQGAGEVLGMLRELIAQQQLTVVIVEHVFNIPHVLEFATTVWTLAGGRLVKESAVAVRERLRRNGVTVNSSVTGLLRDVAARGRTVRSVPLERGATLTIVGPAREHAGPELMSVHDLVVRRGRRTVVGVAAEAGHFRGPTFSLRWGEIGILASPNGWGKTTLLEALAGLIPLYSGSIVLCGEEINRLPVWARVRRGLSLCRAREQGFSDLSVQETLQLSEVREANVAVHPLLSRRVAQLSGGERQKVALACLLDRTPRPSVVLLDESFSAMDPAGLQATWGALTDDPNGASLIAVPSTMQETAP